MSEAEREAYYERQRRRRRRDAARRKRQRQNATRWATVALMAVVLLTVLAQAVGERAAAKEETPVPSVIVEAAAPVEMLATLPAPELTVATIATTEPELEYLGEFRITHYCACQKCCGKSPDDPWYGITATGTTATEGRTIAVDPSVIPYGSRVAVFYDDGRICYYVAEDCGGAINGLEVDVFIADHDRAWELGVLSGSVYIVNEE